MKSAEDDYYFIVICEDSIYLAFWHEKKWYYIYDQQQRGRQSNSGAYKTKNETETHDGGETLRKI